MCARMRNEVSLSGAQAIVMVVGLWQDGILQISMPAGLYLASAFLNYELV